MEEDGRDSRSQARWAEMERKDLKDGENLAGVTWQVRYHKVRGSQTLQFKQGLESRSANFAESSTKFSFPLYLFSIAAVTDYHKFSGLKQH